MITIKQKGDFSKSLNFLSRMKERNYLRELNKYGEEGVRALASVTPVDTGKTASSWRYEINSINNGMEIVFLNSNVVATTYGSANIAILIEYGHGTNGGGYVQGRDYINPTIQPIFDRIAETVWKEMTK